MPYYHVMIKKTTSDKVIFLFDFPRKEIEEKILLPFTKQEVFRCDSSVIRHSEIDEFAIIETELSYSEIHKKTKVRRISEALLASRFDEKEIYSIDEKEIINLAHHRSTCARSSTLRMYVYFLGVPLL